MQMHKQNSTCRPHLKELQSSPTLWPLLKYCVLHRQSLSRQSIEFFLSSHILNEFCQIYRVFNF
jgi:hypothetical protein